MNVILVMIPLSLLLLIGAAIAFFWAVDHDQFDDMETPGLLALDDDPHAPAMHVAGAHSHRNRRGVASTQRQTHEAPRP